MTCAGGGEAVNQEQTYLGSIPRERLREFADKESKGEVKHRCHM